MSEFGPVSRFGPMGYVMRLQRRGFILIGHGGSDDLSMASTYVLAKPGSQHVVKVGVNPDGDPWPVYAAWCFHRPGPFKPVVRSLRWYGRGIGRFFVATMDRLHAPMSGFDKPPQGARERIIRAKSLDVVVRLNGALDGWYKANLARGIDRREWRGEAQDARLTHSLAKRCAKAGLSDVAGFLRSLAAAFPRFHMDPAPHNWMFREDGALVMLDPFTRILADIPATAPRLVRRKA
ncbi:hypothetical protein [Methylorubrum populi]|uniref:hypothetical protein n=1 Tax=Methylorubrum populi TaxID=223967 RepID=UPI0007C8B019|nr:hypothetical protein [Methylorubrum populi]OAH33308.1 hypothetical protein AX289_00155 [Methylorubrum populi]PZP67942.1 MAG: hypothetical protein DI590_18905 [Methylorubrum populi]